MRSSRAIRPIVYLAVVMITLAVVIANGTLRQLGIEHNNQLLFSCALVLAVLICSRNYFYIALMLVGIGAMNLPDATLLHYGMDRDVLTAFVCALILLPAVSSLFSR